MNFVDDVLEQFPASRPAIVSIDRDGHRRVWHFGELIACSAGVSGALAARGVKRGDVVMTLLGNRVEWVLTLLACWRMGAVALPCNVQLTATDLAARAAAASPSLAVGVPELLERLPDDVAALAVSEFEQILDEDRPQEPPARVADLDPDDPALVIFTSGTTGEARGVVHPQRYLEGQALQAEHWLGARSGELVWCTAASGWSKSARNAFLAPWLCGAAALLHDGRFDPSTRLEIADAEGVNVLCQAPTEYRMLAARTELRPMRSMRRMVAAGEALDAAVIETFLAATGLPIHDGYGQTETGHLTGHSPHGELRPGSMGMALPGIELEIDEGELVLRRDSCPTFFSRYLDGGSNGEEWWRTGDLVRRDEEGYLWHEGRADDVIVSSGYRIGPVEVEAALLSHPAVAEAAAVASPDRERGAVVRAIVVLHDREPSAELVEELQGHVRAKTAPYKYPRVIDFADSLPRTASGKIRRAELRENPDLPKMPKSE